MPVDPQHPNRPDQPPTLAPVTVTRQGQIVYVFVASAFYDPDAIWAHAVVVETGAVLDAHGNRLSA